MSIGQRIKMVRTSQGLTIDEVAARLGKNRTTIYRYENGDIENLPLGILDSLATALNTTPTHLMGWENSNGICHGLEPFEGIEMEWISKWLNEMGANILTEEECTKIMEYAKFLISQRNK